MSQSLHERLCGTEGITRILSDVIDNHLANKIIASRRQVTAFLIFVTFLAAVLPARASTAPTTDNLQVIVTSTQSIGSSYLEVQAIMSGVVKRSDGSLGSYKVPLTILYPQAAAQCNGLAIADVVNSVFYETFDFVGTANDPFFPALFPLGRMTLGDAFIQGRGYVYAQAQWNKLVIERQREAGTLSDPTLHIDQGTDGYIILRDLSAFLRAPSEYWVGLAPCAVRDVIGFGYSQTGMLLRQFSFAKLNTRLANRPIFDDGLVFEASLQVVPGSRCRSLTDQSPWFAYTYNGCTGATPNSQGKVITINTETDVQIINGWKARPNGKSARDHYRLYELAGTSHIPSSLLPLKLVGIRPIEMAAQNYADTGPVLRAMVEHLRGWIEGINEPPVGTVLQGQVDHLTASLFSKSSWGNDNQLVYLFRSDADGNALGGVRLANVRTTLPGGQEVGGPLGLYRGVECNNDPSLSSFILDCQLNGDSSIYNMAGGTFVPYTASNPGQCGLLYDSYESYLTDVANAATYAAAQGWILAEELSSLVAAAAQKTQEYPGCIPTTSHGKQSEGEKPPVAAARERDERSD